MRLKQMKHKLVLFRKTETVMHFHVPLFALIAGAIFLGCRRENHNIPVTTAFTKQKLLLTGRVFSAAGKKKKIKVRVLRGLRGFDCSGCAPKITLYQKRVIHLVGLLNSRDMMRRRWCAEEADVSGSPPLFLSGIERESRLYYSADVADDACQKERCVGRACAARALRVPFCSGAGGEGDTGRGWTTSSDRTGVQGRLEQKIKARQTALMLPLLQGQGWSAGSLLRSSFVILNTRRQ